MPKASKKRSAEEVEDGEETPSKRAEVAEEEEEEEVHNNDHDEEVIPENKEDEDHHPVSPDGDKDDNGNSEVVEESKGNANDDEEENWLHRAPASTGSPLKRINAAGRPAEAGVISKVYVENFMCHQKLTVNLCRNVNFIHGQNGSGKSAILAAIQICLGASARRTHRARNLKELVRKEAAGNNPNTSAKVRVSLLNGGEDGYKKELYGEEITVERSISLRNGYNGYKLYDENNKEVSRNKKDLEEMLDHLNIQVENPVAILGQEDAKLFLKGKPTDKYNFFLKATELERLDTVYANTMERIEELEVKQDKLRESLETKLQIREDLKKKVNEFKAVEKLEKKRLDLQVDCGWAIYEERNEEYQEAVQKKEKFLQKVQEKELELTQAEEDANGANYEEDIKLKEERMAELQVEAESQATLKRDLEVEKKRKMNPIKAIQRDIKEKEKKKKQANRNLDRAKKRLKDTRDEIMAKAGSAESEAAQRTALLNETEEALTEARAASDGIKEAVSVSFQQYEEMEPEVEQAKEVAKRKESQARAVEHKLKDLKGSAANDSVAIFGAKCSKVNQLVEAAKRKRQFKGQVMGPVGAFIKVAPGKENYAELAEKSLGNNTLERWVVTCDHDRKVVDSLRREAGCKKECGIFQVHVAPRYQVPPPPAEDIETVASVLSISNDIVFNCLVDHGRIDQRALAPSKEISEQRLLLNQNGRYTIKGKVTQVAFLPRGDHWTVRDGTIAMSSNDKRTHERKIGVDRTKAIADTEKELGQLKTELKNLRSAYADVSKRHKELQKEWNVQQKKRRENEDSIAKLSAKKEEIELEMESTADLEIDTSELEEDVGKAEEELEKLKEDESSLRKELSDLEPGWDDVQKRLEEVETRNEKVIEDMKEAQESLEKIMASKSQHGEKLKKKQEKLAKFKELMNEHDANLEEKEKERSQALANAKELTLHQQLKEEQENAEAEGNPLTPERLSQKFTQEEIDEVEIRSADKDSKVLEAKINRIAAKIEKEKEKKRVVNEDIAIVTENFYRADNDLRETQAAVDETTAVIRSMDKDLRDRRKRASQLHKYLSKMIDGKFDEMLRVNNASGSVEMDEEKKQLNLVVQKDWKDESSQTKDVNALSGGERSFTTISLLMALGECLETPFRVLDEFDVFLDTQDLSSVTPDHEVKIFKLQPPRRDERAGGPTQQTLDFSQS